MEYSGALMGMHNTVDGRTATVAGPIAYTVPVCPDFLFVVPNRSIRDIHGA